jgi:hypothetical protein
VSPRRARRGPGPRGPLLWPWLVGAGLAQALSVRDHGPDGPWIAPLAALFVVLALVPAWLRSRTRRRGLPPQDPVPLVAMLGAVYAAYFGMPALLADRVTGIDLEVEPESLQSALGLATLGLVALWAGYYALGPRVRLGQPLRLQWDQGRARALAPALVLAGSAAYLLPRWSSLPAALVRPLDLATHLLPFGLGLLYLLARRGAVHRGVGSFALFGLAPLYVGLEAGGGYVGGAAQAAVFVAMLLWGSGRRLPLWAIALGVAGLVVLRSGGHEYRRITQQQGVAAPRPAVEQWLEFGAVAQRQFAEVGFEQQLLTFSDRIAQIVLLAYVAERTPQAVPYWNGHSYLSFPGSFVPRFLWPDKPVKDVGQRVGHRYGILDPADRRTSINLPQLVEFYLNFGRAGLCCGMLALGLLYRRLDRMLNWRGAGDANVLVTATLFSALVNIESDFSLVYGGLAQTAAVVWVVLRLLRPRSAPVVAKRPVLRALPRPELAGGTR